MRRIQSSGREDLSRVFIRVLFGQSETLMDLELVTRIDEHEGKMRLVSNTGGTDYFIPDLSYDEAKERLKKLPGVAIINLKDPDVSGALTKVAATPGGLRRVFIEAVSNSLEQRLLDPARIAAMMQDVSGAMKLRYKSWDGIIQDYILPLSYRDASMKLAQIPQARMNVFDLRNL